MYYLCSENKVLISCAAITQLICPFVFAFAKIIFSHNAAYFIAHLSYLPLLINPLNVKILLILVGSNSIRKSVFHDKLRYQPVQLRKSLENLVTARTYMLINVFVFCIIWHETGLCLNTLILTSVGCQKWRKLFNF